MMGDINGDALRGLSDAIKGIKDGGDKLTLTTGTVVSSTASETWVQVDSGQRFPVDSSTVDAAQGDTVNVTIQKGTATITGNSSQKATNANYVDSAVEPVREAAEQAAKAASEATISAGQAKEQATAATEAATEAKEKSQAAADAATAAATSASEAATSAKDSATSASTAATNATNAAASAKTAESKATAAATSASNAENSASAAKTSASNAAADASTAKTQATAAATSASEAESSASAAQTSAKTAASDAATAKTQATNAASSASVAQTSAKTAESKATAAATSASNAETSASNAATDAATAKTQATNAASSASKAETSAKNAESSASAAETSASNAESSASAAKTSASNAASDAATAKTNASNAATSAKTAESKATAAATSASNAQTSAKNAEESASEAQTSASNAETSASSAKTSASNAAADASTAKTQATNAATSAKTAESKATAAATSASNAETSASTAATKADEAATSASAAQTSAKNAESSASAAKTSASNAESSASAAATSAKTAASDAATAKSQATAATTAANEAKTQAASAVTSATEAKTQAAAAKTAADQATTDAATAGIAASRAQTAAQAAEKAIGIEPDDTKTEDELASQAWFWTDGSGAHIVSGRKDGTPTSTTQTDINDKGLSVVSLEDYSTLASFGIDDNGKAVSRLGEATGSYTEVTDSGMDIYAVQGDIAQSAIDFSELNAYPTVYKQTSSLLRAYSVEKSASTAKFNLALTTKVPEGYLPWLHAIAFKLSDLFPLGENNLVDISLLFDTFPWSDLGRWSVGIASKIEAAGTSYSLLNDDGSIKNLLHGETVPVGEGLFFNRGIRGVDNINDCYLVIAFRQTEPTDAAMLASVSLSNDTRNAYYLGELTQNVVGRFGFDESGLVRAKIGSDGYVQIDDMEVDIYRSNATVTKYDTIVFQGYHIDVKPVKEEGWTISFGDSSTLKATVPSGFSGNAYSVFKVVDLFDWIDSKIRKFSLETWATAWASDSSISCLEFYIIDKPYLYDDSGEMVDYLYYSGQELPLGVSTDEMQWAKIQNLYIAFNLATIPDTLPASVQVYMTTSYKLNYYIYTPTGEATLQSHFGRKTELAYREAAGKQPMFSLDPDAGFMLQAPSSTGGVVSGDDSGLYLSASGGAITGYAPKIDFETGDSSHGVERITNRYNYNGDGGIMIDRLSSTGDSGYWIARNGTRVMAFEQSQYNNRGIWDDTKSEWMIYRGDGARDTYINGLASSFAYSSYEILSSKSIAATDYVYGTTDISKSGYKPFAVAGFYSSTRYVNMNRAYLSDISNGSGTITWMVNNWASSAKTVTARVYVLWIRY